MVISIVSFTGYMQCPPHYKAYDKFKNEAYIQFFDPQSKMTLKDMYDRLANDQQISWESFDKIQRTVWTLSENMSDVLFPNLSRFIPGLNTNTGLIPDKARDEKILSNLVKASFDNEDLLIFIEKGYQNFIDEYKTTIDFCALPLADGTLFETYLDAHKDSEHSKLCNKMKTFKSQATIRHQSTLWKKVFIGTFLGITAFTVFRYKTSSKKHAEEAIPAPIA